MANTPMNYTHGVNQNSTSDGGDNHFFMHPSLMLAYPLAVGIVRAHQWYQYSPDSGTTWFNTPNGQFVFDKGVRMNAGTHVFVFSKRNLAPVNSRHFRFEVEYTIGAAPAPPPANYLAVRGRGTGAPAQLNQYARIVSMA
jgi:hypothetical protein